VNSIGSFKHKFSEQYPHYFHFDELVAFSKEIAQTRGRLRNLDQQSREYTQQLSRLNYYEKMYEDLYFEAQQILDLAVATFRSQEGRQATRFFIDNLHQNATAHVYLKKPGENESSFVFTIWTPGITHLDHDPKSYKAVRKEILLLKEKLNKLGLPSSNLPN
jgi:hypothetical protein